MNDHIHLDFTHPCPVCADMAAEDRAAALNAVSLDVDLDTEAVFLNDGRRLTKKLAEELSAQHRTTD